MLYNETEPCEIQPGGSRREGSSLRYFETKRSFYQKVLEAAVPVTAQSMITIGVNLLDTIMLGSLGETALSASSLGNQFVNFFQICCMGIGMGASVLTSRFWGRRDIPSLKKAVTLALRFAAVFATVFTLADVFLTAPILTLYSKEAHIIEAGVVYLRWCAPTFFLMAFTLVTTQILRSISSGSVPLLGAVVAFFVNLGANYVFIFGKLGMPAMGVAGAALGTVIARVVELVMVCGYFLFREKEVAYRLRDLSTPCGEMTGEYVRVSLPVLVSDGLLGLGNNMVAMVMGHVGASFVSANAITTVTQQLSTVFIQGISFSSSFITGQTLGEGRVEDARRQGWTFFWMGLAVGILAGGVIWLIRDPVIGAYNITPATREITYQLMDAISLIVVFQAANSVLTKGVLRGGGDTRFLMVADILFLWVVSIPLGYMAGLVWQLPAFWIYFCLKIDQFLKAFWCVFRLRSGKWIKAIQGR